MATKVLRRVIDLNGTELPIPSKLTYEQAIEHYRGRYPELLNSYMGEQRTDNEGGKPTKMVYKTITKVGTKG